MATGRPVSSTSEESELILQVWWVLVCFVLFFFFSPHSAGETSNMNSGSQYDFCASISLICYDAEL